METIRCHTTTASVIALFAVSKTIESDRTSIITLPSYAYNRCLLSLPARSHVPAFARSGKQTCTCTYDSILSSVAQAWLVMNTHFYRHVRGTTFTLDMDRLACTLIYFGILRPPLDSGSLVIKTGYDYRSPGLHWLLACNEFGPRVSHWKMGIKPHFKVLWTTRRATA